VAEWQWHQLGHMQVCTSLQADNHASTPPLSFFTGRMAFLPPNQQRQSAEGNERNKLKLKLDYNDHLYLHDADNCKKNEDRQLQDRQEITFLIK